MQKRHLMACSEIRSRVLAVRWLVLHLSVGLSGLLAARCAGAADIAGYQIESVAKAGDRVGEYRLNNLSGFPFTICGMGEQGEVAFLGETAAYNDLLVLAVDGQLIPVARVGDPIGDVRIGEFDAQGRGVHIAPGRHVYYTARGATGDLLVQWANGVSTSLVTAGAVAQNVRWPDNAWIEQPISMDREGNLVFAVRVRRGAFSFQLSNWFWHRASQRLSLLREGPVSESGRLAPCLNSHGEIALFAEEGGKSGAYFRDAAGNRRPVAILGERSEWGWRPRSIH